MLSCIVILPGNRRDDTATVDPTDIRGLVTACPGYVAERPRSSGEGQPEGCLIVYSRVLLTGPSRPGRYRVTVVPFRSFDRSSSCCRSGDHAAGMPMFPCDGPHEAQELPGYGRTNLAFGHAAGRKASVASALPSLRFPSDILHRGFRSFGSALQVPGLARREAIAPGRFHQDPSHVGVARLRNRARCRRCPLECSLGTSRTNAMS